MKGKVRYAISVLLIAATAGTFCGCSPQKSLAHRLKGADRVVVTNTIDHLGISVTGADIDKVVQAIAAGKKESPLVKAAPAFKLEFYKGAEHLATITTSGGEFWIGNTPYSDDTETIARLYDRLRIENALRPR